MSKAKKCINCGCTLTEENAQQYISELREQMLCDECQTRVLRFLYIVEQVGGSAMNFYYKHRRELRQEGMSADTLMYIRGVCKKLDDERARQKEEEAERKRREAEERPVLRSRKTVKKMAEGTPAAEQDVPAFVADSAPASDPAEAVDSAFFVDETFAENDDVPLGQPFEDAEEDAFFRLPRFYTPPMLLEQQEAERRRKNRTAGIILAAAAGTLLCVAAIVVAIVLTVRG